MILKPMRFLGDSRKAIQAFPKVAKSRIGHELTRVQSGREPTDAKWMRTIGSGVKEIRVGTDDGQYRVLYVAKFDTAVFVLHAFIKKTKKTTKKDAETARKRYDDLIREIAAA